MEHKFSTTPYIAYRRQSTAWPPRMTDYHSDHHNHQSCERRTAYVYAISISFPEPDGFQRQDCHRRGASRALLFQALCVRSAPELWLGWSSPDSRDCMLMRILSILKYLSDGRAIHPGRLWRRSLLQWSDIHSSPLLPLLDALPKLPPSRTRSGHGWSVRALDACK